MRDNISKTNGIHLSEITPSKTLFPPMSSADNLCKQYRPRLGPKLVRIQTFDTAIIPHLFFVTDDIEINRSTSDQLWEIEHLDFVCGTMSRANSSSLQWSVIHYEVT